MNKITIPALLLGVVMIAGAFAFMPVQEASTVHTTGAAQGTSSVEKQNTTAAQGTVTLTCGSSSACVIHEIYITDEDTQAQVLTDVDLAINGDTIALTTGASDALGADLTVGLVESNFLGQNSGAPIAIAAGENLKLTITGASDDFTVSVVSSGTITIGFST